MYALTSVNLLTFSLAYEPQDKRLKQQKLKTYGVLHSQGCQFNSARNRFFHFPFFFIFTWMQDQYMFRVFGGRIQLKKKYFFAK